MVFLNYSFVFFVQKKKKKKKKQQKKEKKRTKNYKRNPDFLCSGTVTYLARNFI